jgi:superfamily II DNA or RNA helicase
MSATAPTRTAGLRDWQVRALDLMAEWRSGPFLIAAAPGAGKTRPALEAAKRMKRAGEIDRIAVICPTSPLTRQWAEAAARSGLQLQPDAPELRTSRDFDGVAVTYARVASVSKTYARQCTARTLVILDEAHHLGDELAWGEGFVNAFRAADRWLLLSGTPFRTDDAAIPGVVYDSDGVAVPDLEYTYADAIRDGVCRKVVFVPYDGVLQWQSGDEVHESSFDEVVSSRERGRRYRTAISTELPDGLPRILRAADEKLAEVRGSGQPDAGGLVVAANGEHARQIASLMAEMTGRKPVVVLHTEANAGKKLAAFRESRDPWIVAVNMVSEGVDIPRLRVGVYATAAKTPLIFRQIVGRFVRTSGPSAAGENSFLYLPGDPWLRSLASTVEDEVRVARRRAGDDPFGEDGYADDGDLLDAQREAAEVDPDDKPEFVALSADVAPQMNLFGEPEPAPAPPVSAKPRVSGTGLEAPEPELDEPGTPLYARRAGLRAERHKLVGALRRITGEQFTEINARINRKAGVSKVEDATVEQLDRSISLLLDELTKASRRR